MQIAVTFQAMDAVVVAVVSVLQTGLPFMLSCILIINHLWNQELESDKVFISPFHDIILSEIKMSEPMITMKDIIDDHINEKIRESQKK